MYSDISQTKQRTKAFILIITNSNVNMLLFSPFELSLLLGANRYLTAVSFT